MEKVVEAISVCKEFRDFWGRSKVKALEDLNISIMPGEIFGFLGPNGCGKTTTIKLLLGLLFPTSGIIKVFGYSPRHVPNKKRIGFLPEESYLYPYQNAQETLFFYGRLFGYSRRDCKKRVEQLLDMVGLTKAKKRAMKEYSKGMARRIGIAQALINDPDLVFLDEPTAGLDPIGTREVKDLIIQLKERGKTVFLCSHLLADVEDICDRITILYGGKIQAQGTVNELLSKRDISQISLESISDDLREQLMQWLEQKGLTKVKMTTPKEKLESYFLKIVERARAQNLDTSGAEAGKNVSEFLTSSLEKEKPKKQIIEQLLTKDKHTEKKQEQEETSERIAQLKNSNVLENLLHGQKEKEKEKEEEEEKKEIQAVPEQKPASEKTKLVIDSLIQSKSKEKE